MGRVGAAGENAAMESFFALSQRIVLNSRRWATRHDLRLAIVTWIDRTYHRRRRQRVLGKLTGQVRSHHDHTGRIRGLTRRVTKTLSSPATSLMTCVEHSSLPSVMVVTFRL